MHTNKSRLVPHFFSVSVLYVFEQALFWQNEWMNIEWIATHYTQDIYEVFSPKNETIGDKIHVFFFSCFFLTILIIVPDWS